MPKLTQRLHTKSAASAPHSRASAAEKLRSEVRIASYGKESLYGAITTRFASLCDKFSTSSQSVYSMAVAGSVGPPEMVMIA